MNPLLEIRVPIPFDEIRPEHVVPAVDALLQRSQAALDAIAGFEGERTFENTMVALDEATEVLDYASGLVRHLEAAVTSPEIRAAHNAIEPKVAEFSSRFYLNEGLWKALLRYASTDEAKQLTRVKRRYLDKSMDYFRRSGAELDAAGKKRMSEIDVELSALTTKFGENVLDSTNEFEEVITDEAQLAGLPPSAVEAARASAKSKGKDGWRFTLQGPSYQAAMTYLDNGPIRERLYRAYQTRATSGKYDNREIVPKILRLRQEKASMLGFSNFADFVMVDRMAKTGRTAMEFLEGLHIKTRAFADAESEQLLAFRRTLEGALAPALEPWDIGYYAEKERAAKFSFDEEALRPYFPVEQVLSGMFETVSRIFGISVSEVKHIPTWHPEVKVYEIRDQTRLLGIFYADWHPRETKRGGAWMDAFLTGEPAVAGRPHIGVISGNMTAPVEGKPALLTHREVETIFHEFGHLLHHCLSKVEVRGFSGTNVPWDFVELPSQIMENWCWERESLDLFARHWQTGEAIPDALFQSMRRARNYRSANGQMRQLSFSLLDLKLHIEYSPERDGNVVDYSRAIIQQFSPAKLPSEHAMIVAFTHLFGSPVGYGAGYYSYKWAEVLDADAFSLFLERGVLNKETGMRFRESILEKGNSAEAAELYRNFRGRDPELNALLTRLGLA